MKGVISLLAALAALAPSFGLAQSSSRVPRLCFLEFSPASSRRYVAFFEELKALGYIDGKSIAIERQSADGRTERFPALARACVSAAADVIVVHTTPAAEAAKRATTTIPIVMVGLGDPVGSGLVDSLARPGGNVTGLTFIAPDLAAKRFELLKQAAPRVSRSLLLSFPQDAIDQPQVEAVTRLAARLGVAIDRREIARAEDLRPAFEEAAAAGAQALLISSVSLFFEARGDILALARRHRWPGAFPWREYVEQGGLIYYGQRIEPLARRAAHFVDRVVKGAKPADLPVEQPTKFDLIVNLKSARELGIEIPPAMLALADEVIE